jgi:molybdenum cofactor cytidylyltransferase
MNTARVSGLQGVLLAAGAGSRFGGEAGAKLVHEVEGVAIAVRAARNLRTAGLAVIAVLRPGSDALRGLLEAEGCAVTVCENAAQGMGVSLAHGVMHSRAAPGWVVALADMPRIQPATIGKVADAVAAGALLAAPIHHGERGHPVGFSSRLREELLRLKGDEGARTVVKRHHAEMRLLAVDDPGVLFDIDRKEDVPARL